MDDSVPGRVDVKKTGKAKVEQQEEEDIEEYFDAKEQLDEFIHQEGSRGQEDSKGYFVQKESKGQEISTGQGKLTGQEQSQGQDGSQAQTHYEAEPAFNSTVAIQDLHMDAPGPRGSQNQTAPNDPGSYDGARRACIHSFIAVVTQCRQNNEKFTDPEFDLQGDFRRDRDFVYGLPKPPRPKRDSDDWGCLDEKPFDAPGSVHRIHDVMEGAMFAEGSGKSNFEKLIGEVEEGVGEKRTSRRGVEALRIVGCILLAVLILLFLGQKLLTKPNTATGIFMAALSLAALLFPQRRHFRHPLPRFYSSEIQQSEVLGNCGFLSAVGSLAGHAGQLERVCVAWDQECAVYGFLYYRDGAWSHTLVDDYVYLSERDLSPAPSPSRYAFEERCKAHRTSKQRGPGALHFARCRKAGHTWLPLLEKAHAKVHGDYAALAGAFAFEVLQDLTGGVANFIRTDSIADRNNLWRQLRRGGGDVVFGIGSLRCRESDADQGLTLSHAFAIEGAYEFPRLERFTVSTTRLLKIRNPWGEKRGLWQGPWSAGCVNWTFLATWWLRPQLHEDGTFFMTFEDALDTFPELTSVRIMDEKKVSTRQKWAAVGTQQNPLYTYSPHLEHEYSRTFFRLRLCSKSTVTLALSQLDSRYFKKLRSGQKQTLDMTVRRAEDKDEQHSLASPAYIARTYLRANDMNPALHLSLELLLDAGTYEVLLQVSPPPGSEEYHSQFWTRQQLQAELPDRSKKIHQLARNHDAAFQKLEIVDPGIDMAQVLPLLRRPAWSGNVGDPEVCGIGLRVFSEDESMELEVGWREEPETTRGRTPSRRSSAASGDLMGPWGGGSVAKSRSASVRSWKSRAASTADGDAPKVESEEQEETLIEHGAWLELMERDWPDAGW